MFPLSSGRGLRRVSSFAAYSKLGEGLCPDRLTHDPAVSHNDTALMQLATT